MSVFKFDYFFKQSIQYFGPYFFSDTPIFPISVRKKNENDYWMEACGAFL